MERLDRLFRKKVAPTARPSGSVSEGEDAHAGERLAPAFRLGVDDVSELHGPSRPSIAMALPRMIRYTSSSERFLTNCSATARVSGQVESVWG